VIQGFQREAKALASIRSQYVVQVYAFGLHEGSYFFAMEYVRGRTLRKIVAEHREHGDTIPLHRASPRPGTASPRRGTSSRPPAAPICGSAHRLGGSALRLGPLPKKMVARHCVWAAWHIVSAARHCVAAPCRLGSAARHCVSPTRRCVSAPCRFGSAAR